MKQTLTDRFVRTRGVFRPAFPRARAVALFVALPVVLLLAPGLGCSIGAGRARAPVRGQDPRSAAFLDTLEQRTFLFFWERSDPKTGLTPDRWPTRSFASVSATGFALTAYPIGVERGWITRAEARDRVTRTLRFFWNAPQDTAAAGATGVRGFFYHFLRPEDGTRFEKVELSTVDTALLLAGALFCQTWFDGKGAEETELRALVDSLYARVDWNWAQVRPPTIGHGWTPEEGPLPYDWRGYNEAMLVYLLALASPTHPVGPDAWQAWTSGYRWGTFEGQEHVGFAPLFGHQYTQVWVDFRGIRDEWLGARGLDYFANTARAARAQVSYCTRNPEGWRGYGPLVWGLSACDGPVDGAFSIGARKREFHTYWARGASFTEINDDGTIAPTAAAASLPYLPEQVLPALLFMRRTWGEPLFSRYGFVDAFNPTFDLEVPVQHGRVIPGTGWFDTDYLGIDQGPILAGIENYRTGLVWKTMRRNHALVRGLRRAGFSGGWLDSTEVGR